MTAGKPWFEHYPPGVPQEIDLSQYQSINEVLDGSVKRFAKRPAYSSMGRTLNYAELDQQVDHFASFLQRSGLKRGDRVAIMMPNVLQYPVAIFGILRAGLTVVNTNPMYTARELRHQLTDAGVKAIVVLENFASVVAKVLPDTELEHVIVTGLGDMLGFPKSAITNFVVRHVKRMVPEFRIENSISFMDALSQGSRHAPEIVAPKADDVAFLQYTGGTTGVAKGAVLTHGNLVANMLQLASWTGEDLKYGEETIITALPLYHIFALTTNCLLFLMFGGCNHLIVNPRDMPGFVKELKSTNFSAITGVNTLFNGLINTEGFGGVDFSRLKICLGGGMAVQRAVADRWKEITGCTLIEGYGLTESSPVATANPLDLPGYSGSIGMPLPSTQLAVHDEDGNALPQGEVGELWIHGPQVMRGYWQRPDETAKVLTEDGWLKTGDMARMDEKGFFYIVDRKKDMILVSGFNVYPNEIEDVVAAHDKVLEVGAIGVPDSKSGEVVKIVVVKLDDSLTEDELRSHCKENLTGYKVPRIIEFRDELPKTNVGKILRRELRDSS